MTLPAQLRFNWVFFLTSMILQVCITVVNSQSPPSASFHDNGVTRNLRTADMHPVAKQVDVIEDRGGAPYVFSASPFQLHVTSLYESIVPKHVINEGFLASDFYAAWEKAVTDFFKGDREKATMAISTTLAYKLGVKSFEKMLMAAKDDPLTKTIANSLQEARLQYWLNRPHNGQKIFKLLLGDDKDPDVLKNPSLKIWLNYITKNFPDLNEYALLIQEANNAYSMTKFAGLLARLYIGNRLTGSKAEFAALNAIDKQLDTWSRQHRSESSVFTTLRLNKDAAPLTNPAIHMWFWYVDKKLQVSPTTLLFPKLLRVYTEEEELAYAIISFEKENRVTISGTLLDHLLKHWLAGGKSADDVDKLLKRVQEKYEIDESKVLNARIWYVKYSIAHGHRSHQGRHST